MRKPFRFKNPVSLPLLTLTTLFGLSACNLTGFMDNPSGDIQLLDAARACLDRGEYSCALEYYQQISVDSDQKISELSMARLADANLFKTSDLIESLGSGTGGANSFLAMAETLASRGKTAASQRVTIQAEYAKASSISEPTLRAYMQFITAMTMMNQVLSSAVGADGQLTASDIVTNPTLCRSSTCAVAADCTNSNLVETAGGTEIGTFNQTAMDSATNWDSTPSLNKVIAAANVANAASVILFGAGNNNGLGQIFDNLDGLGASGECLKRKTLINTLFP